MAGSVVKSAAKKNPKHKFLLTWVDKKCQPHERYYAFRDHVLAQLWLLSIQGIVPKMVEL